jgi:transposase
MRPLPAPRRRVEHRGQKRGAALGYSGPKPQKGERVRARIDNHGSVLSPLLGAPGNEGDRGLLLQGLKDRKRGARHGGLAFTDAVLNLETGFASKAPRKCVFNAGLKPHIKENPRNQQTPKGGRKRFFDNVLDKLRFAVERPFAWEEKFNRLLLRFETKQRRHLGFTLLAFTLINLREFCGG